MKSQTNTGYVAFLSLVAAIGGILFGYDTAVISGTISGVASQFSLDAMQQGWFVGCALVGSIGGVAVAGVLSDRFGRQADDVAVGRAVHRFGRRLCRQCRLHATGRLPHRGRRGHRRGVDRFADVYFRGRRGALARDTRVALPAGHHGRVPGGLPRELPDTQIGRNGRLRLPVDAEDMGYGVVARHVRCRNAACVALLHRYILHSRKPPLARVRGRDVRAHAVLQRIYRSSEAADEEIAAVHGTASASSKSEWRVLFEPGIRKAVVIGVFIAILGQFMGVNAVLYYGPTIFENAGLSSGDSLFSQVLVGVVNMLTSVLALVIIDRVGRKQLVYWGVSGMSFRCSASGSIHVRRGAGIAQRIPAGVLPGLYFLLRRFYLRRGVGAALGDVPHPGARAGDVDRRACAVGGHLPHRAADALDARKPYARRHVLPLCGDVRPLYVDYLACRSRNHGAFA